jgi:hypothetical protein
MLTVKRLRGMPQLSAQRRLGEQSPECRGERGGISGRNEKTRLFVFYNVPAIAPTGVVTTERP